MWMGARLGGAIAPPIAALLVSRVGWRMTFVLFGSIGILWCIVFWRGYQDDPEGRVSGVHTPAPWREMFTSGTMWALFAMYFCSAYGFYFFVTWLPTFLMKDHGLTLETSGLYAALPLAAGAIGCVAGGELSDWLVRRTGSLKWSRRIIGIGGFLLAAAGFGLAAVAPTPLIAILSLTFASGAHDLMLPVAWATCVDAGGRFGGTTGGFMNMASSLSAMISSVSAAWLSTTFGSFHVMLAVAAGTYFVGGMLWLAIDPAKKLDIPL
jgi:nitrate/nitrite transporter NarK